MGYNGAYGGVLNEKVYTVRLPRQRIRIEPVNRMATGLLQPLNDIHILKVYCLCWVLYILL